MEPNEVSELHEQHEHAAHETSLKPVSFSMAVIAVLVAITTVLGHRTHTEAVLEQAKASDQWNYYQAHRIRQNDTLLISDLLSVAATQDKVQAEKLAAGYRAHLEKWNQDLKEEQDKAREFEGAVAVAERRGGRFDLAEALLEIGLVVTSITLLTRQRAYWYFGGAFAVLGILAAASAYLVH